MIHKLLITLPLLGLPLIAQAQVAPQKQAAPAPALDDETALARAGELGDLKGMIDGSIRWLRAQQKESGAYGDSVHHTAWTLRAFAESPRGYKRHDGPFIRRGLEYLASKQDEGGWIADEGANEQERMIQTVWSVSALKWYDDAESRTVMKKAIAALGNKAFPDPPEWTFSEAVLKAEPLVASRKDDGSWENDAGNVFATAAAVRDLSQAYRVIGEHEKKASPKEAKAPSRLPRFKPADRTASVEAIRKGADYLLAQGSDGRWGAPGRPDAGLTAMAVSALQAVPEPRPERIQNAIDQGLAWLVGLQREDGSIHDGKVLNYTTSVAVMALARAGREEFKPVIERAQRFLVRLQADEGEGYSEGDLYYGGIGYGGDERPDLSNLQMALDALHASGLDKDDPAWQRAMKFLERCQNRSESNDAEVVDGDTVIVSGNDGGSAYMPGNSPAGYVELADGRKVPRSYGSMSYALLKSFLFVGLPKDDPRMQAVWEWIQKNYTLDVNPGFEALPDPMAAYQGLFYYFLTMAQALDLYGEESLATPDGQKHPWRQELTGRLISMQSKTDGSWVNRNASRWWEGNPTIATSYALLALQEALPQ